MARVVHFEIHATEPERAIAFYRDVFGWTFHKWEGPQDYWLIGTGPQSEAGIDGGLMARKAPIEGQAVIAYVCTIDVASIDDATTDIANCGGQTVVPKAAIPGIGWLAYHRDPDGNVFGTMQSDPEAR